MHLVCTWKICKVMYIDDKLMWRTSKNWGLWSSLSFNATRAHSRPSAGCPSPRVATWVSLTLPATITKFEAGWGTRCTQSHVGRRATPVPRTGEKQVSLMIYGYPQFKYEDSKFISAFPYLIYLSTCILPGWGLGSFSEVVVTFNHADGSLHFLTMQMGPFIFSSGVRESSLPLSQYFFWTCWRKTLLENYYPYL